MTPPPPGCLVAIRCNTFPDDASNIRRSPMRSAVTSNPLPVTTRPATIGVADWYFQRTAPLSASTAVTQPCLFSSWSPNKLLEPTKGLPGSNFTGLGSSFTVEHQSTLLTYRRFAAAEKAGPFHSTPPA